MTDQDPEEGMEAMADQHPEEGSALPTEDPPRPHFADDEAVRLSQIITRKENRPTRTSEHDVDFDRDVLHRGVRDAGRWAYGTILVEAWVWNDRHTHLIRPPGGWWLDPVFHQQQHEQLDPKESFIYGDAPHKQPHSLSKCPLCRLTDPRLPTFEPPKPLTIGEGIPGVLWQELQHLKGAVGQRSSHRPMLRGRRKSHMDTPSSSTAPANHHLVWRQVHDICHDPDQPYNPRMVLLAQQMVTKVGLAAAVPFDIQGSQGLVVYYARAGVRRDRLQSCTNERYLVSAAHLIGSAYALRKPRQAVVDRRNQELKETKARVLKKIRRIGRQALLIKKGMSPDITVTESGTMIPLQVETPTTSPDEMEAQTTHSTTLESKTCKDAPWIQFGLSHLTRMVHKFGGGGAQPPPAFNWTQTAWTFIGVLTTLLMITQTHKLIVQNHGPDKGLVLGPFGALMTLLYGLTGAPASQPRNILLGQAISMSIAIGIGQIDGMDPWLQQSLATALAVTAMVKLGITHPPAGAASLLFSTGNYGWYNMLANLIGNVIAIVASTIINDANPDRQYPTVWGAQHTYHMIQTQVEQVKVFSKELMLPAKEEEEEEDMAKEKDPVEKEQEMARLARTWGI